MATEMILVPKTRYERLTDKEKEYQEKVSYYTTLLRDNGINFAEPKTKQRDTADSNETSPNSGVVELEKVSNSGKDGKKMIDADSGSTGSAKYAKKKRASSNAVKYPSHMKISEKLPSKYRLYGKRLLEYIKKHAKNILGWNDKGVIIYRGRVVPKTDIIELVKYIFAGKGVPPTGIKDFKRALKEIRMPKVFLKPNLLQPPGIPIDVKKNWKKY